MEIFRSWSVAYQSSQFDCQQQCRMCFLPNTDYIPNYLFNRRWAAKPIGYILRNSDWKLIGWQAQAFHAWLWLRRIDAGHLDYEGRTSNGPRVRESCGTEYNTLIVVHSETQYWKRRCTTSGINPLRTRVPDGCSFGILSSRSSCPWPVDDRSWN